MGDRTSAWLRIHGYFPPEHVDELAELLDTEYCGPEYDMAFEDKNAALAYIENPTDQDGLGSLYVCAEEVDYGEFNELTQALREWKIPHTYGHESGGGYGAMAYRYDPERYEIFSVNINDGTYCLKNEEVKEALAIVTVEALLASDVFVQGKGLLPFKVAGPLTTLALELERKEQSGE